MEIENENQRSVAIVSAQEETSEIEVERLEKQVELRSRMLRAFLKALRPHDFIDFGGKPYLEGEGAMRIAAVAGLGVRTVSLEKEMIGDGHYKYIATVEVTGGSRNPVTDEGDCASNDRFFQRNKVQPPAAEINSSDVRKKAVENGRTRAICAFLGLKGLSWSDLQEFGFNPSVSGAKVDFKKGGMDEKHQALWDELLKVESLAFDAGVSESKFWESITKSESKEGKTYYKSSREQANAWVLSGLEKFGKCADLEKWLKIAKDKMAQASEK